MKKLFLVLFACLATVGCASKVEPKEKYKAGEAEVEVLFTDKNGYTVHRFKDEGRSVYYVTGPGPAKTKFDHAEGKTTVPVFVQTVKQ